MDSFISFIIVAAIVLGLIIIPMWKIFEKAGKPGWASIIPIYNLIVLAEIAGKPPWWGLLTLIPYVGIIWGVWMWNLTVLKFGKTSGFTVGILLLPIVFIPILGYGDAQYESEDLSSDVNDFGTVQTESNFE